VGFYIIRRLLLIIPTVIISSFIVFLIIRLTPGDIIDVMAHELRTSGEITVALNRAVIAHSLGLDVPLFVQYGRWMGFLPGMNGSFSGIFEGNFGISLWSHNPVINEIAIRWPVTVELGILSLIVTNLISLPIGIYSALRQDTWGDYISRSFAILAMSIPSFWLATMVIVFPSIWWGYTPSMMLIPFSVDPIGNLKMFIVPAIVMGMGAAGMTMRITRTMMLEVLRQDYIRTAWAKGLSERVVILRHALRNAFIPIITLIGGQVPVIVGGAVIIEQIFQLPGMGRLILDSTENRDYPEVMGLMLLVGFIMVLNNLIIDLVYASLDPRIHYQ
jgi:peptide/nickel transport system permease protein